MGWEPVPGSRCRPQLPCLGWGPDGVPLGTASCTGRLQEGGDQPTTTTKVLTRNGPRRPGGCQVTEQKPELRELRNLSTSSATKTQPGAPLRGHADPEQGWAQKAHGGLSPPQGGAPPLPQCC